MTAAEALNAAIDIAGGEYIAFIDTDDYYTREIVHTKKVKVAKTK